jgi:hypothetical protein
MGLTITKTTNGSYKIPDGIKVLFLPQSVTTIRVVNEDIIFENNIGRKMAVIHESGVDSPLGSTVTPCTFDYTGGGVEDQWTKVSHGLQDILSTRSIMLLLFQPQIHSS